MIYLQKQLLNMGNSYARLLEEAKRRRAEEVCDGLGSVWRARIGQVKTIEELEESYMEEVKMIKSINGQDVDMVRDVLSNFDNEELEVEIMRILERAADMSDFMVKGAERMINVRRGLEEEIQAMESATFKRILSENEDDLLISRKSKRNTKDPATQYEDLEDLMVPDIVFPLNFDSTSDMGDDRKRRNADDSKNLENAETAHILGQIDNPFDAILKFSKSASLKVL